MYSESFINTSFELINLSVAPFLIIYEYVKDNLKNCQGNQFKGCCRKAIHS